MKKLLQTLFVFLLCAFSALAQERTITGTVTSANENGSLSGVSIKVKGTPIGTFTDARGKYSVKAPSNGVLEFSFIGYLSQTVTISKKDVIDVVLVDESKVLNEVVVTTALGIKRKADNLSYAQQGIKGDDLTSTRITDLNVALAGKISNVQVRTQSAAKLGATSSVRIRGANSASGYSNDPLYVVNGTPLDDINYINVDDIEDVQVLKGPAAAALYGQRAANGVIMVTTKRAKNNTSIINVNSTYTVDQVGKLAAYQNEYSGGTAGAGFQTYTWKAGDPDEWKALNGKNYHTYYDDASWGPKMDGSEYIPWYAWYPGTQYSFKTASLTPQPDNIKNFYDLGKNFQNNISFAKSAEGYNIRMSYTNQDQTGLMPSSGLKRNYISTQFSYDLNSHFTIGADVNYVNQKVNGEFNDGYGNNASGSFNQWFHRDVDMDILKELQDLRTPKGRITGWNLEDGAGISSTAFYNGSAYWANPYTYFNLVTATNIQDRVYGNASLTYKMNPHFKISGTARHNQRNTHFESKLPVIFELSTEDFNSALSYNANSSVSSGGVVQSSARPATASYRTYDVRQVENNYEFLASYNQNFGQFAVDGNFGGNIRQNNSTSLDNATKGGLVVPDLFTLSNSKITPILSGNYRYKKEVRSLYGSATVNWNKLITLDATIRNDWSSALPAVNNSFLYPSIGLSYLFTTHVKDYLPFISFGKIRGSFAEAGSDLDQYSINTLYSVGSNQFNGNITSTTPNQAIDDNIKPQLSKSYEVGLDLRFLSDRLGFSGTYYNENVVNSIIPVTITGSSGFNSKLINAGKLNRHGMEITIDGYPIKSKSFTYNISLNLAFNRSKVVELYPGLDNLYVGGSDYSSATGAAAYAPGVWSSVGGEWGQIRGRGIKKINGQNIINPATGLFAFEDNINFGSILPKYTGGIVNNLSYKNFNLNFAIDFTKGGKYFSLSDFWGGFSGLYEYTAGLNDKGKPTRDDVAKGGGVHVTGVDAAGKPVDMYVDAITYFDGNGTNKINETHIFDLSYVKLREVNLGYTFKLKEMGKMGDYFKTMQISAFARNPWLIYTKNKNFDPSELTGNYGESGQLPPSKTYGLTLKFGF